MAPCCGPLPLCTLPLSPPHTKPTSSLPPLHLAQAEEARAAAAAKQAFFTKALGDMRLTQSKVTRAVVEAQQR